MIFKPIKKTLIYKQIANQIQYLIVKRKLPKDGRLPTYREIADILNVSIPSVRKAVLSLTVKGVLVSGRGNRVRIKEPIACSE